ncbi:MAG TPA: Uma2 family endonuclease [Gemmatimonadales bacterium]|jgi:Uma2 family endonuclease|nr:Uma2 family endonuclease [Gemmatimonadales bacterium]
MGMAAPTYYTTDMVRQMPDDGNKYEVVHGELLVTPAPRVWHQLLAQRLGVALDGYLRGEPVGHVFASRSDISWGLDDVLVEPDVFVAPLDQVRTLDWAQIRNLLLAVEILSPSSVRYDRFTKRRLYQEQGVPLYWIVDGEARLAEVWRPQDRFPAIERERLVWHPAGSGSSFALELAELFRPI